MSALTFRESAAIALASVSRSRIECIQQAQALADACCAVWGHDPIFVERVQDRQAHFPAQIGAGTIASSERPSAHWVCRRCGATGEALRRDGR